MYVVIALNGWETIGSKRFGEVLDSNKWFYFNYDMRGSTTVILTPTGTYKKDYEYDTFGNTTEEGDSFYNETQFTGSISDKSTGLQYMNARYYNPSTGRFLTQDKYSGNPYDPWTQNLYTYCGNNPVNFIDPTGYNSEASSGGGGSNSDKIVPDGKSPPSTDKYVPPKKGQNPKGMLNSYVQKGMAIYIIGRSF